MKEDDLSEIAKVITQERFAKGLTFQSYLGLIGANRQRFDPHIADFRLTSADARFFEDLGKRAGGLKVVAIGEDWCPDVHRGLPVMAKIADAGNMELRFFPRDKNLDIINLFLKEGKYQSIPVFAFFDKNLYYLCHWIERPVAATRFQEEIRAELAKQTLSEDDTRKAMREKTAPLTESWRQETVRELKQLLSEAIKNR
jgi:thiol-disulfide isomerase/thioredoxin